MKTLTFTSIIKIRIGNPYILVSSIRAETLKSGWKKPMPVDVQINGEPKNPWKINMMPIGTGAFYLYLHEYVRKTSNTKVGDRVRVSVCFDSEYKNGPQHPMPHWFKKALAKNHRAKENYDLLSPSRKKEIMRYFSRLKSDEAKQRNLEKALYVLSGNTGRFMARSWSKGK